ncbi:hypothetical protein F5X68DRAFT_259992 [Plectosphaerella plurivora]|uniref:Pre-mRNA splicing factor n=1 Tax=Plectosphaerella plurivora TaxID=936078 RepID=A0A9P9AD75_9PEZI|nr:hypothetical protein F5X68DRAFT_259992 [Plectosphaerella plurivora]
MTRISVYSAALVAAVAATVMTVASISVPHWISYSVTTEHQTFSRHIGLHRSCSNLYDPPCRTFPTEDQCQGDERYFCSMWRSIGFLASFSVILHLATLVSFLVVMGGGRFKREVGWKVVSVLLLSVAAVEVVIISIVAYLFDNDEQFIVPGWNLDTSWGLCTASAVISVVCAAGLALSAFVLPPEDDYECLEDPMPYS